MNLAFQSIRESYVRFQQLLADILRDAAGARQTDESPDELARVIVLLPKRNVFRANRPAIGHD
ncbi:hypothetical protein [Burkholderia ubonensis]|uniref:Uncharacterized protein n=1 Tax=Burkholderia ubonensis subsp. mesacidophila TaxID=265293 RepID=A0A2A4FIN4_9BURK|nr:hypothetical protein [Burkholderia ubonensis]PCE32498.1 hypothetical protein BZL54_09760 [Burkholderia ubonensis subsp. mesacidophila]